MLGNTHNCLSLQLWGVVLSSGFHGHLHTSALTYRDVPDVWLACERWRLLETHWCLSIYQCSNSEPSRNRNSPGHFMLGEGSGDENPHSSNTASHITLQDEAKTWIMMSQWMVGPHHAADCLEVHTLGCLFKSWCHPRTLKTREGCQVSFPNVVILNRSPFEASHV